MEITADRYPLVSVITLCYNQAAYVEEALDSIRNQTYPNIELILIDDCSTKDNSVEVIENYISKNIIQNLTFIKHVKNQGVYTSVNEALALIKGKYLQFVDADDALLPDKIAKQVTLLEGLDDSYAMVYGDMMRINEKGGIIDHSWLAVYFGNDYVCPTGDIFENVVNEFFFFNLAALIKVEVLKKIQFQINPDFLSGDWYLQLRVARNYKIMGNRDIGAEYRVLETSITRQFWRKEKYHIVLESYFKMFYSLINDEKRNTSQYRLLTDKLRWVILCMKGYNLGEGFNKIPKKKLIYYLWMLLLKSGKLKDGLRLLSFIVFGNLKLHEPLQKWMKS